MRCDPTSTATTSAGSSLPPCPTAQLELTLLHEIVQHACLGLHPVIYARLSDGRDYVFTERYPDLMLPVNGANAESLATIMSAPNAPHFTAQEIPLEIRGMIDPEQLRAIRFLRGEFPELSSISVTPDHVSFALHRSNCLDHNAHCSIVKALAKAFKGKQINIVMVESEEQMPSIGDESDRLFIKLLSSQAWKERLNQTYPQIQGKNQRSSKNSKRIEHHKQPDYMIPSILINVGDRNAYLVNGNPNHNRQRTVDFCGNKGAKLTLHHMPVDPELSLREQLRLEAYRLFPTGTVVGLRLYPHATNPVVACLVTDHNSDLTQEHRRLGLHTISSNSDLARFLFDNLPSRVAIKRIIPSEDEKAAYIVIDGILPRLQAEELRSSVLRSMDIEIYFDDSRFEPLSVDDQAAAVILSAVPSGAVLLRIQRCRCSGELVLHTLHQIPPEVVENLKKTLGCEIKQQQVREPAPAQVKRPSLLIRPGGPIAQNTALERRDAIRYLTALGAAREVGGSSIVLGPQDNNAPTIVMDHGGWPGNTAKSLDFNHPLLQNPAFVFLTHSHHDHVHSVPKLCQEMLTRGRPAQFIMHHATAISMWPTLSYRQRHPGYTTTSTDKREVYNWIRLAPLEYPIQLAPSLNARLLPAGHHIGSTMVLLEHKGQDQMRRVLYTGDLRYDTDFGNRLYPQAASVRNLDALVIEGTNGVADTPPREESEQKLLHEIETTLMNNGTVVLPLLAAGRAQEVLTILRRNIELFKTHEAPILIDGPSILEYNQIFSYLSAVHPEIFRIPERNDQGWRALESSDFQAITHKTRRAFIGTHKPRVILTSGGMIGPGISWEYLKLIGDNPDDKIILTCYQPEGSIGAQLLASAEDQSRESPLLNFKAQVTNCRLSGHNSGRETLAFVKASLKAGGTVVLVHGNVSKLESLQAELKAQGHAGRIIIAEAGRTIELW